MKNILSSKTISFFLFVLLFVKSVFSISLSTVDVDNKNAQIKVVYPKPEQIITAIDSTFILGNVPAENEKLAYKLFINNHFVNVHHDGGFIAFLPITPGMFEFKLEAYLVDDEKYLFLGDNNTKHDIYPEDIWKHLSQSISVVVPEPLQAASYDSIIIVKEYHPPDSSLVLTTGDRIEVNFQGTPDCRAWFAIPGVVDSVPMSETLPKIQPYWGESVFGAGAVPDSLKIKGIYTGFFDILHTVSCDSVQINYFLAPPS
ncbi:MAG: hypothetical protein ACE5D6_05615, partial [Candidatus Zixiibacteriota bacterium]